MSKKAMEDVKEYIPISKVSYFISHIGFDSPRAALSVNKAADLLKKRKSVLQKRIERGTIEHIRVNERAMIPDYVLEVEKSKKTKKNEITVFKLYIEEFILSGQKKAICFTYTNYDCLVKLLKELITLKGEIKFYIKQEKIKHPEWTKKTRVEEYLIKEGFQAYSSPFSTSKNKNSRRCFFYNSKEQHVDNVCAEEEWIELKKEFYKNPEKAYEKVKLEMTMEKRRNNKNVKITVIGRYET